ncbi:hypothetical protein M413DRAFT_415849 [Hebeloma cylindrosporum]|uniref:Major facilitator superfamily (MFS) profile domain-containing protein n=1 Tax=Hebeloma cylindrosporum TaxID=76867 RepID=A0A0C2XNL6_HEBCY|nr:hypothetical protein M413DRAFT_415849 [Hebeloma cylindrosporum h7]
MDGVENIFNDENTPLLGAQPESLKRKRTPLPWLQITIMLLLHTCEPISSQSIYPYINELVGKLGITGGDEQKIGYYAGFIESLFFATEAITVFQWSRTSDHVGRKPVLIFGMVGTIFSMLSVGLSRTFSTLVISRCLCGMLNGNIGVIKSTMGELTDTTNRAEAYALMTVVWALGGTLGPILGGSLTRPNERFPKVFTSQFWQEYPYFLPCLATSGFVFGNLIITSLFFEETVNTHKPQANTLHTPSPPDSFSERQQNSAGHEGVEIPVRALLTFPVVISIANYMTLAFLDISVNALLPLFFHMPIAMGGLGLNPVSIGYIMGFYGAGTGAFQVLFFSTLVKRFGTRRVFIMNIATFIPAFLVFPLISLVAKKWGLCIGVWLLVGWLLCMRFFIDTAYGCIFMHVTESAPNRKSLGAINGLAQTAVSSARAVGPALSTSLFSFSVQYNILGGYGVYTALTLLAGLAILLAVRL